MRKFCEIKTELIENGSNMFRNMPIESFSGDLSSLTSCDYMFDECMQLENFDWKGDNTENTISSVDPNESYTAFRYCPLNHKGLKNALDFFTSNPNTPQTINVHLYANKQSYQVCRFLYSLTDDYWYAQDFWQGLQDGTYDRYEFTGTYNGKNCILTIDFIEKPQDRIIDGDEMFLGLNWYGETNTYEDGAFVWNVEEAKIKTAYRMFFNAGGYGFGLGEGGRPGYLVVRGSFPELENAQEMFRWNFDDWTTVGHEYMGGVLLDLTHYDENMPCKINNVENMVDELEVHHEETLKCIANIAQECVCETEQCMGSITLPRYGWDSWRGELYPSNLSAEARTIYTDTFEGEVTEYFENQGWNVEIESAMLLVITYKLTRQNKLGKTISLYVTCVSEY